MAHIPIYTVYSWKFGNELNLAVWQSIFATAKLKSANITYLHIVYVCMAIPYRTANFKPTNIYVMADLGSNC